METSNTQKESSNIFTNILYCEDRTRHTVRWVMPKYVEFTPKVGKKAIPRYRAVTYVQHNYNYAK